MNLSTTPLLRLDMIAEDASVYLKLGDLEPDVAVKVKGYDSRVRLRIPREAGLRIGGVEDPEYLETVGLIRAQDAFMTAGYDTLAVKIDVELDDRFRSLSIDFY
jgi:hypothetical protein